MSATRQRIVKNVIYRVTLHETPMNNAMDVLKVLMQVVEGYSNLSGPAKKQLVIDTFEDIVSGKDGILGTEDDLFPPHILVGMEAILRSELLAHTIDLVYDATLGRVLKTGAQVSWFTWLLCTCCGLCSNNGRKRTLPTSTPASDQVTRPLLIPTEYYTQLRI